MRIAIDAMGGDHAPQELVAGVLESAKTQPDWEYILVGQETVLNGYGPFPANIRIHHAETVMAMDESVEHIRQKKDCSIWQATQLVKDGTADFVVSAGSTGAQMACALLQLGRIKGIDRPAICIVLPTMTGGKVILDVGANADVRPQQLVQFALMGSVYYQTLFGKERPEVALLSNGSEEHKGNELVLAAHGLLKTSGLNFVGNKEGRDVPFGEYDVLVTDGFTGNIVLKLAEGLSKMLFAQLKEQFLKDTKSKLGAALVKPGLRDLKRNLDYTEHGGAPLLGVKGLSIVCHGSSNAKAIRNAIAAGAKLQQAGFVEQLMQQAAQQQFASVE